MDSHAYVIQDSDQFIKFIVDCPNFVDLPQEFKKDLEGFKDLKERYKVAIFQLLQSLNRKNIKRLLMRPLKEPQKMRSTRKNLRDILQDILNVLYSEKLEFNSPFEFYGEECLYTVI